MSYQFPPKLDALVRQFMATGNFHSEDDVLLKALRVLEQAEIEWRAVQESLIAFDNGERGCTLDEAFAQIREKHGVSPEA